MSASALVSMVLMHRSYSTAQALAATLSCRYALKVERTEHLERMLDVNEGFAGEGCLSSLHYKGWRLHDVRI